MHSSERGKTKTLILQMSFCQELLASNRATRRIERSLNKPFAMKVIMLMCRSIWTERNGWLFQNKDSSVQVCILVFKRELALVLHRAKKIWVPDLQSWLSNLA
jgi:hypothetical protein